MNYKTFFVWLLLVIPVQLDKLAKSGAINIFGVFLAFLSALGIALFWTFISSALRKRFFKDLTDSYVTKIQIGFVVVGLFSLISECYRLVHLN